MSAAWQALEARLRQPEYALRNGRGKDQAAEDFEFPSMVGLFQLMVDDRAGFPPTQTGFEQAVLSRVKKMWPDWATHEHGIRARASRAYIGFVVQLHARLVLEARYAPVLWDHHMDLRGKVDLVVILGGGQAIGLALRCPTERAADEAARKARQSPTLPFPVVGVVVTEGAYTAGDFWLHTPDELYDAVERGATEVGWDGFDDGVYVGLQMRAGGAP
jgi:hypothetical protein